MSQSFSDRDPITVVLLRWLSSQPFTNVLLLLVLSSGGWLAWYTINTAIPSHLKMIQDGYDRQRNQHTENLNRVIDSYERSLDRLTIKE